MPVKLKIRKANPDIKEEDGVHSNNGDDFFDGEMLPVK